MGTPVPERSSAMPTTFIESRTHHQEDLHAHTHAARATELLEKRDADPLRPLWDQVGKLARDGQREVRALLNRTWTDDWGAVPLTQMLKGLAEQHEAGPANRGR